MLARATSPAEGADRHAAPTNADPPHVRTGRTDRAALRSLDLPTDHVARLWHATTLLREYRGDGHNMALGVNSIGGSEAHVLFALSIGLRPAEFGRLSHLPTEYLDHVLAGLRRRGLINDANEYTDAGRTTSERIEALTDDAGLEPLAAAM